MTLEKDQPGAKSRSSSARSRSLLLGVLTGVVVMVILIIALATIFTQQFWPEYQPRSLASDLVSVPEVQPAPTQNSFNSGQPAASASIQQDYARASTVLPATETRNVTLPTKQVVAGSSNDRPTWTATPLPTDTPSPTPSPIPTFVGDDSYTGLLRPEAVGIKEKWIDVNLTSQTLVAFEGSAPVFQSLVSSGTAKHPTVTGQFRIWLRFSAQDMDGRRLGYDYNLKGVPYVQYFYEDYALHGTYWHSNFGTPMSHGCVNLPTPSAEWIFNWADYGTLVNIHK